MKTIKYVANCCYGGFELPQEYLDLPECLADGKYDDSDNVRADPALAAIVERADYDGDLSVLSIPAKATDIYVTEYDGAETVLYVLNGKIHEADEEEEEGE